MTPSPCTAFCVARSPPDRSPRPPWPRCAWPWAAILLGLPVARTKVLVYLLSGTLAGAAGAPGGARLGSGVTTVGVGYELTAIASVVIGGTVCGVLLLAVIHQLIDRYLSQYGSAMTNAVDGAFLALVVLAQAALERSRRR